MTSWTFNFIRSGSFVIFLHDIADVLLEAAKTFKCANYEKLSIVFLILFSFTWIITRLGIFAKLIYSARFETSAFFECYPFFNILGTMNVLLLTLHIMWTFMIFKSLLKLLTHKKFDDVRSSTEEVSECEQENEKFNGLEK